MRQPRLYWEDFAPGDVIETERAPVTKEEILEFAQEFDPQPFHLDEAAAEASLLGGLCASGWHTSAMLMRMMCDAYVLDAASLGAPGVEEARWSKPVYVGDRLTAKATCLASRASASRPAMGLIQFLWEAFNQKGELVASLRSWSMLQRRQPGEAA